MRLVKLFGILLLPLLLLASCQGGEIKEVQVESVKLNQTSVSLSVKEEVVLYATVSPTNAVYNGIIWNSKDPGIAVVKDGRVIAVSVGTTQVTATAGTKSAVCFVQVVPVEVSSVTLDKTQIVLKVGETDNLIATVNPNDATDKTVSWTSSDESIATVTDGVVKAHNIGMTTVIASSGGKIATCKVTVEATPVVSVTLDKTSVSMRSGQTVMLSATVKPDDASDKTVTWRSSDPGVATVEGGLVRAVKVGEADIVATAGDKMAVCRVMVEATPVTSITLDRTSATLKAGQTVTLNATVKPDDASDKSVTWSSSDPTIATVESGKVTAVKVGTATITAKAGDQSATCTIIVEATPVTSIALNRTAITLRKDETFTLVATVNPDDATDKTVMWTSSDNDVATVQDGVVCAISIGTAVITAEAGSKSANCTVTVEATPVMSVSLDKTSLTLTCGDEYGLKATITPDDATDKSLLWSSSNTDVATVDSEGVVKALSEGNATITVTTVSESKTATCEVTVKAKIYPVTGVSLNSTSLSMTKNETAVLVATITPANASNKLVNWSSDDESVATVDAGGKVTATGGGTATITVETVDGGKTATCFVSVYSPVISVSLDQVSTVLKIGDKLTLKAIVNPDDASEKGVTWNSSTPGVASVDENGTVTALSVGTATITVTTKDGGKQAICHVTVKKQLEDYDEYELF